MKKTVSIAAGIAIIVFAATVFVQKAPREPIKAIDGPLWCMRSQVTPANLSTEKYRYWAIDVPVLNQWVYFAVLKAAGLAQVPTDQPPCWSYGRQFMSFFGNPTALDWRKLGIAAMTDWQDEHGRFAPRKAIAAVRIVDAAAFAACVFCLWLTARLVLKSRRLAGLCVLPLVLSPVFATDVSFRVWSGDVFLLAGLAATLAAWTWFHLKGKGTTRASIITVGILSGLAAGAKHPGILAVAAFAVYLAWQSKGPARLKRPLAAAGVALLVFVCINPVVVLFPREWPWNVCLMMATRRAQVNAIQIGRVGPLYVTECFNFFWWPFFPAACCVLWASRREEWFPSVGLWAIFLAGGMVAGMMDMKIAAPRYLAPLELGLFFPVGLAMMALARRHAAAKGGGDPTPRS